MSILLNRFGPDPKRPKQCCAPGNRPGDFIVHGETAGLTFPIRRVCRLHPQSGDKGDRLSSVSWGNWVPKQKTKYSGDCSSTLGEVQIVAGKGKAVMKVFGGQVCKKLVLKVGLHPHYPVKIAEHKLLVGANRPQIRRRISGPALGIEVFMTYDYHGVPNIERRQAD